MRFKSAALFMLVLIISAHAEDFVAINSNDGRDVLSGVFYANVKGLPVKFMPSPGGDPDLFSAKVGGGHSVLLIQSASAPVSAFVQGALEGRNNTVQLYAVNDSSKTNLALAALSGASSFIIVDSAYSDSAISVLPYAALTKSYVILADKDNIGQVEPIVHGHTVMIYGLVDGAVRDGLAADNPETVGDGSDKFQDNIQIVNKTMSRFSMDRVLITDGSFLEESMTKGDQPILFIGRLVPQATYDFVKGEVDAGRLRSVMLVGSSLVVPVYDMRTRMQNEFLAAGENKTFGITVKFAQVVPSAGSGVLTLDTFGMPAYKPSVALGDVLYDQPGGRILASVNNTGDGAAFYSLEVRVLSDGNEIKVLGGDNISLIERGESQTVELPLDLSSVAQGDITYMATVKYGGSRSSLEEFATASGNLTTVNYADSSNVTVQIAKYDADNKRVLLTLRNNGAAPAYSFSKLSLVVGGLPTNVSAAGVRSMEPSSLSVEEFPLELSDSDLAANRNVTVYLQYGGRPGFLLKKAVYVVGMENGSPAGGSSPLYLVLGLAILLLLAAAIAFYAWKKK